MTDIDVKAEYRTLFAEQRDLTAGIAFLMKTLEKKTAIPILSHILFPGNGTMHATDLDATAVWVLDGVGQHMPFTVSADSLQRAIKGADGALVSFEVEAVDDEPAGRVVVRAAGMTSKLVGLPVEDFPLGNFSEGLDAAVFTMPQADCAAWLGFIQPCISTEETRYYLNGILLHSRQGVLCGVATDGHRLAIKDTQTPWAMDGHFSEHGTIFPRKAVDTVLYALGKKPVGSATMAVAKLRVQVSTDKWSLTTKAVDGTFPDYTRVIPGIGAGFAAVDRDAGIKAVARMIGVMGKLSGALQVDTAENTLTCKNNGEPTSVALAFKEVGVGEKAVTGFGVNPAYLKMTLEAFPAGDVYFSWASEGDPVRFQAAEYGWNSDDYLEGVRICMPMRY